MSDNVVCRYCKSIGEYLSDIWKTYIVVEPGEDCYHAMEGELNMSEEGEPLLDEEMRSIDREVEEEIGNIDENELN